MKLQRFFQKIFGQDAQPSERSIIGFFAETGTCSIANTIEDAQSLNRFEGGIDQILIGENSPTKEDVNSLFWILSYQIAYLMQNGIPEWNEDTEYYLGSICRYEGELYKCRDDNDGSGLTNEIPSSSIKWESLFPKKKPTQFYPIQKLSSISQGSSGVARSAYDERKKTLSCLMGDGGYMNSFGINGSLDRTPPDAGPDPSVFTSITYSESIEKIILTTSQGNIYSFSNEPLGGASPFEKIGEFLSNDGYGRSKEAGSLIAFYQHLNLSIPDAVYFNPKTQNFVNVITTGFSTLGSMTAFDLATNGPIEQYVIMDRVEVSPGVYSYGIKLFNYDEPSNTLTQVYEKLIPFESGDNSFGPMDCYVTSPKDPSDLLDGIELVYSNPGKVFHYREGESVPVSTGSYLFPSINSGGLYYNKKTETLILAQSSYHPSVDNFIIILFTKVIAGEEIVFSTLPQISTGITSTESIHFQASFVENKGHYVVNATIGGGLYRSVITTSDINNINNVS